MRISLQDLPLPSAYCNSTAAHRRAHSARADGRHSLYSTVSRIASMCILRPHLARAHRSDTDNA